MTRTILLLLFLASVSTAFAQGSVFYWIGSDGSDYSAIYRHDLTTGVTDTLVQARNLSADERRGFFNLAIDVQNDRLFWTDSGGTRPDGAVNIGGIGVVGLDGDGARDLAGGVVCGLGIPTDIEINPESHTLYFGLESDCIESNMLTADATAENVNEIYEVEASAAFAIAALEVDTFNGALYWSNVGVFEPPLGKPLGIFKAPLDETTDDQRVVDGAVGDFVVDETGASLFWTPRDSQSIWRSNLDGAQAVEIIVSDETVGYLAVDRDGQKLYWSEPEAGRIRRANVDGTGVEDVLVGLSEPRRIELGFGRFEVGVAPERPTSDRLSLRSAYPNPTTGHVRLTVEAVGMSPGSLKLYDRLGRLVDHIAFRPHSAGSHTVEWDLSAHAAGLYLVVLEAEGGSDAVPITLTR